MIAGLGIWCRIPAFHIRVPDSGAQLLHVPFSFAARALLEKHRMTAQVPGHLSPTEEVWIEFQVPGLSSAQPLAGVGI